MGYGDGGDGEAKGEDAKCSAGVSLFHMVMSRASCSASSSSALGEGSVGAEGIGEVSKNLSEGGRKGGRIATSSLSSLLRSRRESAGAELGDDNLSRGGELYRRKKNGGGGGSTEEDWMAMNLEKLSSFRVPETRIGFSSSEGDRKVWQWPSSVQSVWVSGRRQFFSRTNRDFQALSVVGSACGSFKDIRFAFGFSKGSWRLVGHRCFSP